MTSLKNSGRLLKSFPIHPLVLIFSVVTENFFNFVVVFLLTMIPSMFLFDISFYYIFLVPLAFVTLLVGVITLTSLAAVINVFYRDMKFILSFLLSISFFLTPIFYDINLIPENLKWIISINVFYYLIAPFRELLHRQDVPAFAWALLKVTLVDLGLMAWTYYYWNKKRNELYAKL